MGWKSHDASWSMLRFLVPNDSIALMVNTTSLVPHILTDWVSLGRPSDCRDSDRVNNPSLGNNFSAPGFLDNALA